MSGRGGGVGRLVFAHLLVDSTEVKYKFFVPR
jgi:hypothetical protein